jgi:hypothetical protein
MAFLRRIAVALVLLLAGAPAWAETILYKHNTQNQLVEVTRGGDILLRLQGHVFNVVNQHGQIRFIDAQTGEIASFEGYQSFGFLRTR